MALRVSADAARAAYPAGVITRGRRLYRGDVEGLDAPEALRERVLALLDGPYVVRAYLESRDGELARVVVVNSPGT